MLQGTALTLLLDTERLVISWITALELHKMHNYKALRVVTSVTFNCWNWISYLLSVCLKSRLQWCTSPGHEMHVQNVFFSVFEYTHRLTVFCGLIFWEAVSCSCFLLWSVAPTLAAPHCSTQIRHSFGWSLGIWEGLLLCSNIINNLL